ncbi:MAG: hypothetical protein KBD56_05610 [Candidatus Eisenbacteria bacterium]|nr:hypothetical protein [Candidatus Eisenbacteria bacterium]
MRATKGFLCVLAILSLAALAPKEASAIPVFARKYGFNCTMCHSAYPQLNDFGSRYRDNGYRLPGREGEEKTVLQSPAPLAMRTSGGYTYTRFWNVPEAVDTRQFQLNGLDLLSAGLLGAGISYLAVYTPEIAEMRGTEGQTGTLEMASVVFSDVVPDWLNIRAGRFEPAYVTTSVKRRLTISPYEIYEYMGGAGLAFSETQSGLELSGRHGAIRYAAGFVNGSETNRANDIPSDFYGRAAMVFGPGEGQTAGQRIGLFGYSGKARPLVFRPESEDERLSFQRYGVDAALNLLHFHFSGQFLLGKEEAGLWEDAGSREDADDDADFSGGFAEVDYFPMVDLAGFARYDWVAYPDRANVDLDRITGGLRFYFVDQMALHIEYSQRRLYLGGIGDDQKEELGTLRLDLAF